jgi:putative acetyltransferase
MITIRTETAADVAAVREVHRLAFERPNEASLVDAIRDSDTFVPELSLVADEEGRVVGHVLFSRITVRTDARLVRALSLAPIAVHPDWQHKGVGSQLIWRGLAVARRLGHRVVIVIGHPDYYPRFGFEPARARGLEIGSPLPDGVFLVQELVPGALNGVHGLVEYPPAFDAV